MRLARNTLPTANRRLSTTANRTPSPLSAAVNILLHVQLSEDDERSFPAASPTSATPAASTTSTTVVGAVWDIARRCDAPALRAWLSANAGLFTHGGERVAALVGEGADLIHEQVCMLQASHRAALRSETGVEMWRFDQRADEAVMVPAGCPHQVRNLRPCIKAAVDFVSPESISQVLARAMRLRALGLAAAAAPPRARAAPAGQPAAAAARGAGSQQQGAGEPQQLDELFAAAAGRPLQQPAASEQRSAGGSKAEEPDPASLEHADKLQARKVLVWGAVRAWRALQLLLNAATAGGHKAGGGGGWEAPREEGGEGAGGPRAKRRRRMQVVGA